MSTPSADRPPVVDAVDAADAEAAALGAILWSPAAARAVLDVLRPEHFSRPWQGRLLQVLAGMQSAGVPIDPLTARSACHRRGLGRLDGRPVELVLCEVAAAVPVPASGRFYAQIVLEQAARRRLTQAGQRLVDLAAAPGRNPAQLAAAVTAEFRAVRDRLDEATQPRPRQGPEPAGRALHALAHTPAPAREADGPDLAC